jgi:hypothetical protein
MKEYYDVDLESTQGGYTWMLYRQIEGSEIADYLGESADINEIFKAMLLDKASRGRGNSIRFI